MNSVPQDSAHDGQRSTPNGVRTIGSVIMNLWDQAHESMTPAALEWFSGAGDAGWAFLNDLAAVTEGVGCLMLDDGSRNSSVGSFQDTKDASGLLFVLAQAMSAAAAMVWVGCEAQARLCRPHIYAKPRPAVVRRDGMTPD